MNLCWRYLFISFRREKDFLYVKIWICIRTGSLLYEVAGTNVLKMHDKSWFGWEPTSIESEMQKHVLCNCEYIIKWQPNNSQFSLFNYTSSMIYCFLKRRGSSLLALRYIFWQQLIDRFWCQNFGAFLPKIFFKSVITIE